MSTYAKSTVPFEGDEFETVTLQPNMVNLINLHTVIYNKERQNPVNMVEGVDPRIANDTSDIQEALNSILVEHVTMMNDEPECTDVFKDLDDITPSTKGYPLHILTDSENTVCYSRSRYALLICGSNLMSDQNGYGANMNIKKVE